MGPREVTGMAPGGPPRRRTPSGGGAWKRRGYGAAVLLPVAAMLAVIFVGPASAAGNVLPGSASKFESGDGDMTLGAPGNTDWNCFVGGGGFQPGTPPAGCLKTSGATQTSADATGETKLTSGTKFDDSCITFSTSNTPPKDDFTNIAEYSDTATNGDTYLYAGAIRSTNNGNASGNVEFDQNTGGCRTAGDKLLAYDFVGGGTSLQFSVSTWTTNPSDACNTTSKSPPCWSAGVAVSSNFFNGQSNQAAIAASDNGINGQVEGINQFLEFGADLTNVLGLTGCKTFPQNIFESRSSGSSFTSNPEDIEIETRTIQTCGEITIIKQTDPRGQNQIFNFSSANMPLAASSSAGGVVCSSGATAGVQANGSFCLNDTGNAAGTLGSTTAADNSSGNTVDENNLPRNTYTVTQGSEPTGYVSESVTCTADATSGSTGTVSGQTVTISLQPSGHVTCLYIDEKQFTPSISTAAGTATASSNGASASSCPAITAGMRVAIGSNACDTATLSGTSPTGLAGTVTYTLYSGTGCSSNTPTGASVFTDLARAVSSNGTVPNSATTPVTIAGDYQWQAVFASSNNHNLGATSPCGSETFTVGPNSPAISTTAGTGSGTQPSGTTPDTNSDSSCAAFSGSLSIGAKVCDTASLSKFATPVAGTVTYNLYYAGVSGTTPNANTCGTTTGTPGGSVVFSDVQTVSSTGTVPNSTDFAIANAGNYQWQAVFTSTNGQNNNTTSPCGSEQFTVAPQAPTLTTTAGTGGSTRSATSDSTCTALTSAPLAIGTNVCDTASLSGTSAPVAGNITYKLYYAGTSGTTVNANSCSGGTPGGSVVFTDVETVSGTVPNSADFTILSAGNYQWQAVFVSTNAQNTGATSACSTEQFLVGPNTPNLATTAGTGSGVFKSGSTPDANTDTSCSSLSGTLSIGTNVCDTATLTLFATPVAGTVTYHLYFAGVTGTTPNGNSCSNGTPGGTGVFTDVQAVDSTGHVRNSADFTIASAGNYQWQAVFTSTNAQNAGATSSCATEQFTVGPNSPNLGTTAGTGNGTLPSGSSPDTNSDASCATFTGSLSAGTYVCDTAALTLFATPVAGTITFNLYFAGVNGTTPNANSCTGNTPGGGSAIFTDVQTVSATGTAKSADYKVTNAGNYQWQAVFASTNAQNNGATSTCGSEDFTVGPASPTLATVAGTGTGIFPAAGAIPDTHTDAGCTAFTGTLTINTNVCDTATLASFATPVAGTVTYNLYYAGATGSTPNSNSCSVAGSPNGLSVFTDVQSVASSGVIPNSADFKVTSAGNYQWQALFTSTNAQNLSATSLCNTEPFTVAPNGPTFTTAQNLLPNDSATLTGTAPLPPGVSDTFTFDLYNPTNTTCSGTTGDYHEVVTVTTGDGTYSTNNTSNTTNSMAATAGVSPVGTWRWKVVFSGDLNNSPFTVACGVERFTIANS